MSPIAQVVEMRNIWRYAEPMAISAPILGSSDVERTDLKRQVNVSALYSALDSKREAEGLSWREVARAIGVNHTIFTRLSQGKRPDVDTFVSLTGWLGMAPERFVEGDEAVDMQEETIEVISSYLRADRSLKPKSAQAIESVLRAAYEQLTER